MIGSMSGFLGFTTTGLYCRPGCARNPNPANVRDFTLAAAAEAAGFRACLRCRPYRTEPSSNLPAPELVCRAVQLVLDGALDGGTETELGARLGISGRHLRRLFLKHLGATPDQLARSRRTHFARRLLDDTDFTITEIALAAGFGSVRQFNRECRQIFRDSPGKLRARRRAADRLIADGGFALRMTFQPPLDWGSMLAYLERRAIAGVEHVSGNTYRRTVVIEGDPGVIELSPGGPDYLVLRAHLPHWEGLIHVVQRARRIFNLDTDVVAAATHLAGDPVIGPLIGVRPGIRPPGTWDPFEVAIRTIVDRHVDGGATIMAQIVDQYGTAVAGLQALGLTHLFPSAAALAGAEFRTVAIPSAGIAAINAFSRAVAAEAVHLDRGAGLDQLTASITAIPGLDQPTADYLAFRIGEPDALPEFDGGISQNSPGVRGGGLRPQAEGVPERWRPWRAHAAAYQWLLTTSRLTRRPPRSTIRTLPRWSSRAS
jgi:AraC family transcriptional regulator of adaptative response / DNA-3-methyladenine glycosylase II